MRAVELHCRLLAAYEQRYSPCSNRIPTPFLGTACLQQRLGCRGVSQVPQRTRKGHIWRLRLELLSNQAQRVYARRRMQLICARYRMISGIGADRQLIQTMSSVFHRAGCFTTFQ